MKSIWTFIAWAILATACSDQPGAPDVMRTLPSTGHMAHVDREVAARHGEMMEKIVGSVGRPDRDGYLGRNRRHRSFHSVRFQYGSGRALRYAVATDNEPLRREAMRAIFAGLAEIRQDGSFPATYPPPDTFEQIAKTAQRLSNEREASPSDAASAAAFFLSDACPALLSTTIGPETAAIFETALIRLSDDMNLLETQDSHAPNRLLINALAFHACGQLVDRPDLADRATRFVELAVEQLGNQGAFIEGGGTDTSYQAVSIVALSDLVTLGRDDLADYQAKATLWLVGKLDPQGRLDSRQNTRTCASEAVFGRPKEVDLREVYRALAYGEVQGYIALSQLKEFELWLNQKPKRCP